LRVWEVGKENLKLKMLPAAKDYLLPSIFGLITRDGILGNQFNKKLESLLHAIHSPFYWRILKKTRLFSGFF
jgi:hypothetical protein